MQATESNPKNKGKTSVSTHQRGKNWNEDDSILLVRAYIYMESIKKRIYTSRK